MKKSRFLSLVLAVTVAISIMCSFAIVSEAKTEDNKAVLSFTAVENGTTWDINVGLKINGGLKCDDNTEAGTGVVALQFGFNDVERTQIKKATVKGSNMTIGTLSDGTGFSATWGKLTGDESVYGDSSDGTVYGETEPYTIATILTKYKVADYTNDQIVALFNNVGKTVIKVATFDVMYDNLSNDYFTSYGVDSDGATKTADADYVLGTPKNATPTPSVKKIDKVGTDAIVNNATDLGEGKKTEEQIGAGVGITVTLPDGVKFDDNMIWSLSTADGKKFSNKINAGLSALTGDVKLAATFVTGSHLEGEGRTPFNTEITGVNAIFKAGEDFYFTDAADAKTE